MYINIIYLTCLRKRLELTKLFIDQFIFPAAETVTN